MVQVPDERHVNTHKTVVFACLHGAGMSRMAAAYFNSIALPDWHAVSAGVEPAESLSPTAATLLEGSAAEKFLDRSPPRALGAVTDPHRVIALKNPAIQFELASAEVWDCTHSAGPQLRDEIQLRAEALARSIATEAPSRK
jgi:arsenate reductase (thioredoxin)